MASSSQGREYQLTASSTSGFEVGTEYKRRAGFDLTGRGGVVVGPPEPQAAADQARHPRPWFPNAFFVQPTQGANLAPTCACRPSRADSRADGQARASQTASRRSSTRDAEDRWVELLLTGAGRMIEARPTARPATTIMRARAWPGRQAQCRSSGGADGLLQIYRRMAGSGQFEGLQFHDFVRLRVSVSQGSV